MLWLDVLVILTIIALAALYVFGVAPTIKRSKRKNRGVE
jgi:hypothetical protein